MKKFLSFFLTFAVLFSLVACQPFAPSDTTTGATTSGNATTTVNTPPAASAKDAAALVTLDINPSIELTLDEEGLVASVYGANEDGQILLYQEADAILSMEYEDAVAYITDLAVRLGYLDEETGTVRTSVIADDAAFAAEVLDKLGERIRATATEKGITVSIDSSDPISLLSELEELKKKYPDRPEIQGLTPADYRMAATLAERADIPITLAVTYDTDEALGRISAAHATLESYATEAYLAAKREASRIFERSMGIVIAGAYNEVYMKNITAHLGTFYYGAAYQAYQTSAITYRSVYEIKQFGDAMADYEPTPAMIEEIKTALSLSDTTPLENGEGKITLESLIAFCDSFVAENELLDDLKDEILRIVGDAKAAAELCDKATTAQYAADMAALQTQMGSVILSINTAYNTTKLLMNDAEKAAIEETLADLAATEEKVGQIISGGITLSEVEVLATEAEEKAADMLEKIEADLSEAELAEANAKIEERKALQSQLTTDFENRLLAAEETAKQYIEEQRAARQSTEE